MALINCPDCNAEVSDRAAICPQCGRPMKKKRILKLQKREVTRATCILIAAILIVVGVLSIQKYYSEKPVELEGRFYRTLFSDDYGSYIEFLPEDDSHGDYTMVNYGDKKTFQYTATSNTVTLQKNEEFTEYTRYKNYLIPVAFSFNGEIPNSKTFNAVCTSGKRPENFSTEIVFKSDGTAIYEGTAATYERIEDKILIRIEGFKRICQYVVYNGRINFSYLEKIDESEIDTIW